MPRAPLSLPCLLTASLLLVGCKEAIVAPQELAELSPWIWENFDDADPEVLQTGVQGLMDFAGTLDTSDEAGWEDRGFLQLDKLSREAVADKVDHNHDPKRTIGLGLFRDSAFGPDEHLQHIGMPDQTPVEPASPDHYTRDFHENGPGCMGSGDCEVMRSWNDIERDNFLYKLSYDMGKDWRWVEIEQGDALVARSWNIDENTNDGSVRLLQGYSIDVFLPRGTKSTRYQVIWQETELPGGLTDDGIKNGLLKGIEDVIIQQDEWFSAR